MSYKKVLKEVLEGKHKDGALVTAILYYELINHQIHIKIKFIYPKIYVLKYEIRPS